MSDFFSEFLNLPLFGKTYCEHAKGLPEVKDIVGRFLEEVVELGLASGMSSTQIVGHVMDTIHNECLKKAKQEKGPVYPSELYAENLNDCWTELGDVLYHFTVVKYVLGRSIDLDDKLEIQELALKKHKDFIKAEAEDRLNVSNTFTLYIKK